MSNTPQDICSYLLRYAGELSTNPEAVQALRQFVMGLTEEGSPKQPIQNQTNTDCQQFYGQVSGCVFAMPGSTVYQQLPPPKGKKSRPKAKSPHPEDPTPKDSLLETFTRRRGLTDQHFALLHSTLQREGWIADESPVDEFLDLFSGRQSACKVIWNPHIGKGILRDLFKMMADAGFIAPPPGRKYIRIVESHFIYPDGRPVTGLKGGYTSQKAKATITSCRDILLLDPRAKGTRSFKAEIDDEFSDIRYSPYD